MSEETQRYDSRATLAVQCSHNTKDASQTFHHMGLIHVPLCQGHACRGRIQRGHLQYTLQIGFFHKELSHPPCPQWQWSNNRIKLIWQGDVIEKQEIQAKSQAREDQWGQRLGHQCSRPEQQASVSGT